MGLGSPAELVGKISEEGEDVIGGLVIGDQDVAFLWVNILQSMDPYLRTRDAEQNFSPEAGDKMGGVPGRVEERENDRDCSQYHGNGEKYYPANNGTDHGLSLLKNGESFHSY
jgi:hypothetical protein